MAGSSYEPGGVAARTGSACASAPDRLPVIAADAPLADAAAAWAAAGFAVFPCRADGERPKKPLWSGWQTHAARTPPDAAVLLERAQQYCQSRAWAPPLIGVVTGPRAVFILDLDPTPERPLAAMLAHAQAAWGVDPEGPGTDTPRGGRHLYFSWPPGLERGGSAGKLGAGFDTRGSGGYIIAPPSRLPDGRHYTARHVDRPLPVTPPALINGLRPPHRPAPPPALRTPPPLARPFVGRVSAYAHAAFENELDAVARAPEGRRNDTLYQAALKLGTLAGAGRLPIAAIKAALMAAAAHNGLVQEDGARAVSATIDSGLRSGFAHPRALPAERRRSRRQTQWREGRHG